MSRLCSFTAGLVALVLAVPALAQPPQDGPSPRPGARRGPPSQDQKGSNAASAQEAKRQVVFDGDQAGASAKGWTHAPMGKVTIAAQDKEVRRNGKKTMEFHAAGHDYMGAGWNWMGFDPPDAGTDISGYKNLRFWAKVSGEKKPSQLSVAIKSNDKSTTEVDDMLQRCPSLLDGKWHELVIPINDLDSKTALNKAKAWELQFNTWSQEDIDFSLFVDEIAFDGTADKASQATASPAAAEDAQVAPRVVTKREVVYDGDQKGASAKGWTAAPMGKVTLAAQDKVVRRKGKKTMEFHAAGHDYMGAGWNWMGFDPPDAATDCSGYKNLSFWAKVTGPKKPSQLSAALKANDKSMTEADDLLQRCPNLLDGKWHELVVPISDLDSKNALNKAKAWEVQFNTWSQEDIDFSLFVDEIAFDGTADKASQGTAGPATAEDAQVAPRVVTKREVVYDGDQKGASAKGWTAAPMGKVTLAAQDKVVRRKGKKTMEFHAAGHDYMGGGWNWMGFDPPDAATDVSGYKNLSFWAKVTGAKKPSQLSVAIKANDKSMTEADDLLQRCPNLLDGKWHELVIPINDLDSKTALNKAKAWEVQFNTWSQEEIDFSLFVDEIGFDGTAEAVSQAAEPVQVAAVPDKSAVSGSPANLSEQIMVDQFGFRPNSEKIVIFASPEKGQNSRTRYTPPAQATVRSEKDGAAVLTVALKPWGGGKLDQTSGDKVWYADISRLQTPGNYYVWDASNRVRSYGFRIADDVYLPVLKAAIRAYFYQRCGGDVPEANGGTWHHPACHLAAGQDREAELYIDGRTRGQPRDVHGGWHDAGDYNKYVPFTLDVVQALLMAYEFNPAAFGDDWNIPESGNGIPDILDEVRWECDWLLRMQMPDGSVCNRVTERTCKSGVTPDKDSQHPRYYTQPTTWATATCAANLAYFARVIGKFPGQAAYARKCRAAAERAWTWLEEHPQMMPADGRDHGRPSEAADGACDNGREGDVDRRVSAALQLWLLDPKPKYEAFFKRSRKDMLSLCFVQYALSPKADPALRGEVCAALQKNLNDLVTGPYKSHADAYLAYLPGYWWGCNQSKSEYGYRAMFAVRLGMNPAEDGICRAAAEDYLHFLHGRNPLCLVYLTNMGAKGAKAGVGKSIMRPFHNWFAEKSPWSGPDTLGPAPGLLVGGPNAVIGDGGAPGWLSPPAHEPPSKAFKDWATGWNAAHQGNENSWAFTEPAIYYQARYVLLLSQFVGGK